MLNLKLLEVLAMTTTNTLTKRIDSVKAAGKLFKDSNMLKDRKREIENFLPSINDLYKKFNSVESAYKALKPVCQDLDVDFKMVHDSFTHLKEKIDQDNYDKVYVNNLNNYLEKIYSQLNQRWKNYISSKISSIDGVLDTLGNLIDNTPEKIQLQKNKSTINLPGIGNPNVINAIDDYISTYNKLVDKLKLEENIMDFLKLLASGKRVTFDDIDDDVYKWIREHNFSKKITIHMM